jgi:hypothetical protein
MPSDRLSSAGHQPTPRTAALDPFGLGASDPETRSCLASVALTHVIRHRKNWKVEEHRNRQHGAGAARPNPSPRQRQRQALSGGGPALDDVTHRRHRGRGGPIARDPLDGKLGLSGPLARLRGLLEAAKRLLGHAPQFTPHQELDESSPPPGRELEVSIQRDTGVKGIERRQRDVLVVHDAERHVDSKREQPRGLRLADVHPHAEGDSQLARPEVQHLAFAHRPGRRHADQLGVGPALIAVRVGQHRPYALDRRVDDRGRADDERHMCQ